jgi:hypothetical protein
MNVIRHDHISPDADAKVSCSSAILNKRIMYLWVRKQVRTYVSVESDKIDWRIGSLEN